MKTKYRIIKKESIYSGLLRFYIEKSHRFLFFEWWTITTSIIDVGRASYNLPESFSTYDEALNRLNQYKDEYKTTIM